VLPKSIASLLVGSQLYELTLEGIIHMASLGLISLIYAMSRNEDHIVKYKERCSKLNIPMNNRVFFKIRTLANVDG